MSCPNREKLLLQWPWGAWNGPCAWPTLPAPRACSQVSATLWISNWLTRQHPAQTEMHISCLLPSKEGRNLLENYFFSSKYSRESVAEMKMGLHAASGLRPSRIEFQSLTYLSLYQHPECVKSALQSARRNWLPCKNTDNGVISSAPANGTSKGTPPLLTIQSLLEHSPCDWHLHDW